MTKRLFDLLASSIGLVILSPVMVVIGLLVKRDSEGPALFKQERIGRGGNPFTLWKFRSMAISPSAQGPLVTTSTDARVTKVGTKIRAAKLDELPQLFNVVLGDMSIVGPRPEVAEYVELWPPDDRQVILSVRPGITDPATVQLRREEEILSAQPDPEKYYREFLLPEKARLYREYVEEQSLWTDVALVFSTLASIVRH